MKLDEYINYLKEQKGMIIEKDGRYAIRPIYEDTETLKMYKNIPRELDKIVKYGKKFSKVLYEKVDAKRNTYGNEEWLYYEYSGNKYYITGKNLLHIISSISIGVKPLLYGSYGVGKTVISRSLLAKMFDREPVYVRLHGTPSVEETVGEIDPIQTYLFSEIFKSFLLSDSEESNIEFYEINPHKYIGNIKKIFKTNFVNIDGKVREIIKYYKLMSISMVNMGIALIENRPVVLDEIDKLNNIAANFFGSVLQQIDPEIQLPGLGMVEFKQPIITISNTLNITEFIKSRLEEIHQPHLPPEILEEMLEDMGIEESVRREAIEKYISMITKNVSDLGTRKIIQYAMKRQVEKEMVVFI